MNDLEYLELKSQQLTTLLADLQACLDNHKFGSLAPHALDDLKMEIIQIEEQIEGLRQ